MIANNAHAGTYYVVIPGARTIRDSRELRVQDLRVTAMVTESGEYTVFAGGEIVSEGVLDGTEGVLNDFFAAEALIWNAKVETERAEHAAECIAAFEAEVTALAETPLQRVRSTLGKGKLFRAPSGNRITPADMALAVRTAERHGGLAVIAEINPDYWAVEIFRADGSLDGRFYYSN